MFYIVGLGNPGEKYQDTRHNIGWMVLDAIREQGGFSSLHESGKYSGRVAEGVVAGREVSVLYPDTYMNNSGGSVKKFVPKGEEKNLIVIHDEIDLPFGEIKVVSNRGAGGNNGVKSVIDKLGTKDFVRIRVGIAPTSFWTGKTKRPKGGGPLERFVLKPFTKSEQKELDEIVANVIQALQTVVTEGPEVAMNQYN